MQYINFFINAWAIMPVLCFLLWIDYVSIRYGKQNKNPLKSALFYVGFTFLTVTMSVVMLQETMRYYTAHTLPFLAVCQGISCVWFCVIEFTIRTYRIKRFAGSSILTIWHSFILTMIQFVQVPLLTEQLTNSFTTTITMQALLCLNIVPWITAGAIIVYNIYHERRT